MLVVFTIIGGILGFEFQNLIVIIATSFIGSYITVRSLSLIFGGFPNEFDLTRKLQTGVLTGLPWYTYLYLALILILFFIGLYVQRRTQSKELKHIVRNDKLVGFLEGTEKRITKE